MKLQAPIEVELKVSLINPDEHVTGVATIGLGKGEFPTEEDMRKAISDFETNDMPEGFRLMNKREWFDTVIPPHVERDEDGELHTTPFAMPGDDDWDD